MTLRRAMLCGGACAVHVSRTRKLNDVTETCHGDPVSVFVYSRSLLCKNTTEIYLDITCTQSAAYMSYKDEASKAGSTASKTACMCADGTCMHMHMIC